MNNTDTERLAENAIAISLLDSEIEWGRAGGADKKGNQEKEEDKGEQEPSARLLEHKMERWSKDLLEKRKKTLLERLRGGTKMVFETAESLYQEADSLCKEAEKRNKQQEIKGFAAWMRRLNKLKENAQTFKDEALSLDDCAEKLARNPSESLRTENWWAGAARELTEKGNGVARAARKLGRSAQKLNCSPRKRNQKRQGSSEKAKALAEKARGGASDGTEVAAEVVAIAMSIERDTHYFTEPEKSESIYRALLQGEGNPFSCLGLKREGSWSLHALLDGALRKAIRISRDPSNSSTKDPGALYLYDAENDELVMAASRSFPLRMTAISLRRQCSSARKTMKASKRGWKHALPPVSKEWKVNASQAASTQFLGNLYRLHHIKHVLRPRMAHSTIPREPWIREELRGWHAPKPSELKAKELEGLDCNKLLVGIAYYKPGQGITGQLFDQEKGLDLEREQLIHDDLGKKCDNEFGERPLPVSLREHFKNKLLRERTVVYQERGQIQMAALRTAKAGFYEGLQFPSSLFIGPFLGTVLRFNGEHLGILKVERHKFNPNKPHEPDSSLAETYKAEEIVDFLLFSYALSGVLYVLKHHAGVDLREGWIVKEP